MRLLNSLLASSVVFLLLATPLFSMDYPLSETAARAAYFLGQRRDIGEFISRYSKHLPAPKIGPYISDVTFFTPYAQLVVYPVSRECTTRSKPSATHRQNSTP